MKFMEKIKKNLSAQELDELAASPQMPNRAARRERSVKRYRQFRRTRNGNIDFWEWKPTQRHPARRREDNRRRNRVASASRRANR